MHELTISELIAMLQAVKEEHGDLPVYTTGYSSPLALGNRSVKACFIRKPEGRERVSRFDNERGELKVCRIF